MELQTKYGHLCPADPGSSAVTLESPESAKVISQGVLLQRSLHTGSEGRAYQPAESLSRSQQTCPNPHKITKGMGAKSHRAIKKGMGVEI